MNPGFERMDYTHQKGGTVDGPVEGYGDGWNHDVEPFQFTYEGKIRVDFDPPISDVNDCADVIMQDDLLIPKRFFLHDAFEGVGKLLVMIKDGGIETIDLNANVARNVIAHFMRYNNRASWVAKKVRKISVTTPRLFYRDMLVRIEAFPHSTAHLTHQERITRLSEKWLPRKLMTVHPSLRFEEGGMGRSGLFHFSVQFNSEEEMLKLGKPPIRKKLKDWQILLVPTLQFLNPSFYPKNHAVELVDYPLWFSTTQFEVKDWVVFKVYPGSDGSFDVGTIYEEVVTAVDLNDRGYPVVWFSQPAYAKEVLLKRQKHHYCDGLHGLVKFRPYITTDSTSNKEDGAPDQPTLMVRARTSNTPKKPQAPLYRDHSTTSPTPEEASSGPRVPPSTKTKRPKTKSKPKPKPKNPFAAIFQRIDAKNGLEK